MGEHPETDNKYTDDRTWQIDKRIPLALIFVFICQTLGVVWAAAQLSAEVKNLRETTTRLETRIDGLSDKLEAQAESYMPRSEAANHHEYLLRRFDDLEQRVRDIERRK